MYTITELLSSRNSHLQRLVEQSARLQQLTAKLRSLLPSHLAAYCGVAAWENEKIFIHASNAAAGTVLRYHLPNILPLLQLDSTYKNIQHIICHIRPHPETVSKKNTQLKPPVHSVYAATLLQSTAENVSDPHVKAALKRLAQTLQ